ncbi:MAG: putative O-methyltransferase [Planctomycetes bacterium ADurb.Bin126]|nr:MAG: putative O-methyltransferase [Planctomycetes bacterium ADurb.Bin126]HOD82334.1 O-methyltransferase [Phycisphaerae bacterium]HQL71920.1 O-methyltransferase [Phycisphaerae bacterium]
MRQSVLAVAAVGVVGLLAYVGLAQPYGRPPRPGGPRADAPASSPLPKDDAEKKILDVLDDMDRNQRRGMLNVPKEDGRLLRVLAESVGAKRVVEIGTSNGYSGIWFCLALRQTGGKLYTYEIDAGRAKLARENFKRAGVDELVTIIEGDAHKELPKLKDTVDSVDVVFLDADKDGYIDYLKTILPLVRPGGLILAHNVAQQAGSMKPFLEAITSNKDLETLFVHMQAAGVSVSLKKR